MAETAEDVNRSQELEFAKTIAQSLQAAEDNLDGILEEICHKKWEKEVVQKRMKPHTVGWVFSQAQDCYFVKPDPAKIATEFD